MTMSTTRKKPSAPRKPVHDPAGIGRESPSARRAVDAFTPMMHWLSELEYRVRFLERVIKAAGIAAERAGEE